MEKPTTKKPARSRFWIIDTSAAGGIAENSRVAFGPFDSITDAEIALKSEAKEAYLDADKSLREMGEQTHWAAPMIIVEERKAVRQVPVVNVTVRLEEVEDEQ